MKLSITAGCCVMIAGAIAFAQDSSLIGKYSGSFQGSAGGRETRIVLNITSVEGGAVNGTVERYASGGGRHGTGAACAGEHPVEGTHKENTLQLRSVEKVGKGADCGVFLKMQIDGNKLTGNLGQNNLT